MYSVGHYGESPDTVKDPYQTTGGIALHELTHAIQGTQFFNGSQDNDGNFDMTNLAPCWLIEGQAQYDALAPLNTFNDYRSRIQAMYEGQMVTYLKDSSPNNINRIFQNSLPAPQCHDAVVQVGPNTPYRLGYGVGMFAVQALTAVGGIESVLALYTEMAHGMLFPDAFKAVYNYDWTKASMKIATLISTQTANFHANFPPGPIYKLDGTVG